MSKYFVENGANIGVMGENATAYIGSECFDSVQNKTKHAVVGKRTNESNKKEKTTVKKPKKDNISFIVVLNTEDGPCNYGIKGELNEKQMECLLNASMKDPTSIEVQIAFYLIGQYDADDLEKETNEDVVKMVNDIKVIDGNQIIIDINQTPRSPVFVSFIDMFV